MRLLAHGFSTAETTLVTSTAIAGTVSAAGSAGGKGTFKITKVTIFCGGTTVAPNTSGGIKLNYGDSSASMASTIVFPTPVGGAISSAVPVSVASWEVSDLNIHTNCFKVANNEAATGGWTAFVFGE